MKGWLEEQRSALAFRRYWTELLQSWRRSCNNTGAAGAVRTGNERLKQQLKWRFGECCIQFSPEGTMTMIPVTCPQVSGAVVEFLLEPPRSEENTLPEGLLLSPSLVYAGGIGPEYLPSGNIDLPSLEGLSEQEVEQAMNNVLPGIEVPQVLQQQLRERSPEQVVSTSEIAALPGCSHQDLSYLQKLDPIIGPIVKAWGAGSVLGPSELSDGHREIYQLLLPQKLQREVFSSLHDNHGHQGKDRTAELVKRRCYWPGMMRDVEKWCRECQWCILAKLFNTNGPASDGRENVLVLTDVFSKFTQAIPTRDQRASTVAEVLVRHWFHLFGVPCRLHSDQGRNFESNLIGQLCKVYGVHKSRTTAYLAGIGHCERFKSDSPGLLRCLPQDKKKRWPQHLPQLVYAYNTTVHHSTGMSPYFLMFGCEPKLPVDFLLNNQEEISETPEQWIVEHQGRLQAAYGEVQERLREKVARRNRSYKGRINDYGFREGELVYLKNHHRGRHKIQDVYDSCLYKVVREPGEQGAVYSVAPVSQAGPVKQVHRMEMRKAVMWILLCLK
ncbi:hypothetical protein QQF64_024096 [Cirrhinus molitorella]|uniref:Gypsy retrotransposon integrase-like protein 1 n=1 Tax=Cirrhinus molitorella TaxID=172907 RepID=A0ABR3NK89_9TELE